MVQPHAQDIPGGKYYPRFLIIKVAFAEGGFYLNLTFSFNGEGEAINTLGRRVDFYHFPHTPLALKMISAHRERRASTFNSQVSLIDWKIFQADLRVQVGRQAGRTRI